PPYCERLGIPFPFDGGPGLLSMEAIADPPAYNRARAAVRYDEIARKLVHGLKYGDRLDLAPTMGAWMARAGRDLPAGAETLVPVPLHWRRQWARRFNQSALLAHIIANAGGRMVAHRALKRVKATPQQVGLDKSERAQNVQGAFRVPAAGRAEVAGRRLLLIDDVLTSGATVNACARALLRAGATCVDVLVFARVVAGRRAPPQKKKEKFNSPHERKLKQPPTAPPPPPRDARFLPRRPSSLRSARAGSRDAG